MEAMAAPLAPRSRRDRIRTALTPAEWRRAAGLAAVVVGLHVVGFFLLLVLVVPHDFSLGGGDAVGPRARITAYPLGPRPAVAARPLRPVHHPTPQPMGG